ncbi:MAG: Clp protease ClpP [Sphingobacteriaceae bacterium]
MQRPFYSIISNQAEQVAEILIYGLIGEHPLGEGNAAKFFLKDFQEVEKTAKRIHIRINSPGGSVWEGLPIFNAIRASKSEVHTYIDGIAFSMAAVIALAGHKIHMAQGSLFMLHNVSGGEYGNAEKMRKAAALMDKHDAILIDLIAQRSGRTVEFVKTNWMNYGDNYFSPEEARSAGLIDFIESHTAENIPSNIQSLSPIQIAAFYQKQELEPHKNLLEKLVSTLKTTLNSKTDMQKIEKQMDPHVVQSEPEEDKNGTSETPEIKVFTQLLERFDQLLERFEAATADKNADPDTLPAKVEALRTRLDAVVTRPTTPYAQTDRLTTSPKENFETSYDRELRALVNR